MYSSRTGSSALLRARTPRLTLLTSRCALEQSQETKQSEERIRVLEAWSVLFSISHVAQALLTKLNDQTE
jgi:hypothetical protein